jgi:hypothetical protein
MSMKVTPILLSPRGETAPDTWPALPTETEIYILPNGQVVVADLPAELAPAIKELGVSLAETAPAGESIGPFSEASPQ